MYVFMNVCMYVCLYVYECLCVLMYVCMYVCMYVYMYACLNGILMVYQYTIIIKGMITLIWSVLDVHRLVTLISE